MPGCALQHMLLLKRLPVTANLGTLCRLLLSATACLGLCVGGGRQMGRQHCEVACRRRKSMGGGGADKRALL